MSNEIVLCFSAQSHLVFDINDQLSDYDLASIDAAVAIDDANDVEAC